MIVDFKRAVYEQVIDEFMPCVEAVRAAALPAEGIIETARA